MSEKDLAELQFFAGICTVFLLLLNLALDGRISVWVVVSPLIASTVITLLDIIVKEIRHK